ncbi:MAG: phage holin, LLH family [Bacillota bacterium]|nr:phage holin, LLH family [Bacillota bacterium]
MNDLAKYILDGILTLAMGIALKFAVPYIKSLLNVKNFNFISAWVDKLVAAAEQTIQGTKMGATRKLWVINMLNKLGIAVDDGVNALIEASVKALNDAVDEAAGGIAKEIANETSNTYHSDDPVATDSGKSLDAQQNADSAGTISACDNNIEDGIPVKAEVSE